MEHLIVKRKQVLTALATLKRSINSYGKASKLESNSTWYKEVFSDQDESIRSIRDSMIQRFEFSIDLIWKYLKEYLTSVERMSLEIKTPRSIFRSLCNAKILSEKETEFAIEMVDNRNRTSHIYKEEMAEEIASQIPEYHLFMSSVMARTQLQTEQEIPFRQKQI